MNEPADTGAQTDSGASEGVGEHDRESYGDYSIDDEDQLQSDDTLVDRGVADALDEGYSPPDRWSAGEGFGNTPYEELVGETLDQRIAQEIPEPDPYEQAANESESISYEVGDRRTGRLVAEDEGRGPDNESDMVAEDIGIDGAGASAEEAAMHTIDEE